MFRSRVAVLSAALLAVGFVAAMAGCDWLSSSGSSARTSPFLSNMKIIPSSVLCDTTFSVSFKYDDPQGDIATARVTFQRSGDTAVREEAPPWPGNISRGLGTVSFPFTFTACAGKGGVWTVKVQLQDDAGHSSNILSAEIRLNTAG